MSIKWTVKDVTTAYEQALGGGKKPVLQGLADKINQLVGKRVR